MTNAITLTEDLEFDILWVIAPEGDDDDDYDYDDDDDDDWEDDDEDY